MQVCLAQKKDAPAVAVIHKKELPTAFLSRLGIVFLSKFYEAIISHPGSFCIVAKDENGIKGFVSGTSDIGKFYKYFVKNYGFFLALVIFPKLFRFSIAKNVFENLFYANKINGFPDAELLSIAVDKNFQKHGTGSELIGGFIYEMEKRGAKSFKVLVGKELGVAKFYLKNNFKLLLETKLHGKDSFIFIYNPVALLKE